MVWRAYFWSWTRRRGDIGVAGEGGTAFVGPGATKRADPPEENGLHRHQLQSTWLVEKLSGGTTSQEEVHQVNEGI